MWTASTNPRNIVQISPGVRRAKLSKHSHSIKVNLFPNCFSRQTVTLPTYSPGRKQHLKRFIKTSLAQRQRGYSWVRLQTEQDEDCILEELIENNKYMMARIFQILFATSICSFPGWILPTRIQQDWRDGWKIDASMESLEGALRNLLISSFHQSYHILHLHLTGGRRTIQPMLVLF